MNAKHQMRDLPRTPDKGHRQIPSHNAEITAQLIQPSNHRTNLSQMLGNLLLSHQGQSLHKGRTRMQFDPRLHRTIQDAFRGHSLIKDTQRNLQKIHCMRIYGRNGLLGFIDGKPDFACLVGLSERNHSLNDSLIPNS